MGVHEFATSRPRATTTIATPVDEMWWRSSKPKTLIKEISPEVAFHLLDRAPDVNRPVHQTKVMQFARLMAAGMWRPVEEQCDAFAFDREGRCINGQHRMWAVIEAKKAITFEIKLGLPTEAIDSIDDHLKRSDADVYKITHGGDATAQHLAVAVRLIASRGKPRGGFDRATKFDALNRYKKMIDKAMALIPTEGRAKVKGLTCASMLAVLTRATHTVQLEKLQQFVHILQTGIVTNTSAGSAVILLRDWMMQNGAASAPLQTELYWKAERALRAFLDQDEVKTLYAASGELFPLPGEEIQKKTDVASPRRLKERKAKRRSK